MMMIMTIISYSLYMDVYGIIIKVENMCFINSICKKENILCKFSYFILEKYLFTKHRHATKSKQIQQQQHHTNKTNIFVCMFV